MLHLLYRTDPEVMLRLSLSLGVAVRKVKKAGAVTKVPARPRFTVRELDPQRKCGPGTSVQRLYRVDEQVDGSSARSHLVFFDRHGWYCEHGRDCPAVSKARKHR